MRKDLQKRFECTSWEQYYLKIITFVTEKNIKSAKTLFKELGTSEKYRFYNYVDTNFNNEAVTGVNQVHTYYKILEN